MKKKKMKKVLAAAIGTVLALSSLPALGAQYVTEDDTVVYIDFEQKIPNGYTTVDITFDENGVYGMCGVFDGSTTYIQLPDGITEGVTDFTMSAWVKFKQLSGWQRIFDFGGGTSNYAFLGLPYSSSDLRAAVKANGGTEWNMTASGVMKADEWIHVALTQKGDVRTLYVNGEAVLTAEDASYTLDEMGSTTQNYIGRSQFSSDPYFDGYLDEVIFAKRAFSADEIAALATVPETVIDEDYLLSLVDIPNADSIKENLSLPSEVKGAAVKWTSSDENAVNTKERQNGDYIIPPGVVTRGEEDRSVTLTAEISKDGMTATKVFNLTIKAKPEEMGEMGGYLYAYFRGNVNGSREHLQIHVAASEDGYNWFDLNGNYPILTSEMGTRGLRDPYIIRSKDGDRFYLLATDLDTETPDSAAHWYEWSMEGSKYLMIWESDDLIHWSEQRMVKFADDSIGCAWAPEAIWDEDTQEYIVYAAGKDLALYEETGQQVDTVYVVRTRDFRTFSEPEKFTAPVDANGKRVAAIDSTIIRADDGRYYQFYKKYNSQVVMMVSDHASGPYEEVSAFTPIGGEGPAIYKVNGSEQYCLCIDNYSVYVPYLTDDISSGIFTKAAADVKMPTGSKHGVMIPLTTEEYERVLDAWGGLKQDEDGAPAILKYDFEQEGDYSLYGNAKVEYSEERASNVLILDGSDGTYLEFPENLFDRRNTFTLSFDVKENNETEKAHMTFAVGQDSDLYYFFKTNPDSMRSSITITGYAYEEKANSASLGSIGGQWQHIDLVVEPTRIAIYRNGAKVAENTEVDKTISHLGLEGLKAYLGKSFYSADPYFNGEYDNVELYNRALSDSEIAQNYVTDDEESVKLDSEMLSIGYDFDAVKGNVNLASAGIYGSSITWETSDASVIALDGTVNVPSNGEGDRYVTLTATVTKGEARLVRVIEVTVKESVETWVSKADYSTYSFAPVTGEAVFSFDITADELTDGVIGICGSSNTPSYWSSYNMAVRIQPDGTFDAYNGSGYQKTNTITYEAGKSYKVIIKANVSQKTYSVYVIKDGEINTVGENYTFRSGAPVTSDLAKVTVRGGDGKAAGLFEVSDFKVQATDTYIENAAFVDGKITCDILSLSEKSGVMCVALYDENGALKSVETIDVAISVGYTAFEKESDAKGAKLMLWDSVRGMAPFAECKSRSNVEK